ncbi:MAG: ribonuclease P protein component [Pseudobdellovibrionaceae bacterium]
MTQQDTQQNLKIGRLKKRADFLRLGKEGERWVTPAFIVQRLKDAEACEGVTCGFTVTKKTAKRAVDRNRIKRRLRALAAEILPEIGKSGEVYVLIGREAALSKSYEDLKKDLRWAVRKLNG